MKFALTRASEFAASWIEAWNSHDLDRIAAFYSENALLSSPFVRTITGGNATSIRGRLALQDYFSAALQRFPSLYFRLRAVYAGEEDVILVHDSVNGLVATEKLNLNEKGQIVRVWVYYGRVKTENADLGARRSMYRQECR